MLLLGSKEKNAVFTFLLALITVIPAVNGNNGDEAYRRYYVERACSNGSLTIRLASTGPMSAGILMATSRTSYSLHMTCTISLVAPHLHYILVSLRETGFRVDLNGNCKDYLVIDKPLCETMKRLDEERHYTSLYKSTPNVMNLTYHTSDDLDNKTLSGYPGFTLIFTAFQKASDLGGSCSGKGNKSDSSFQCSNNYCIWSGLTCDGHNNCGDLSDEETYGNSNCGGKSGGYTVLIILGLLILFLLIIMCVTTLLCSKNETVRRFSTRLRSRSISFLPRLPSR
ncbi:uncharacterized protein LOC118186475 [Stegodyphus dumicola]|uniref:uncharacterized protein LOC118186475 n=1 Tax=Stegodyphus dumicola TaxID=202533 RepID=UPI0015AA6379|nr:uncharacterized protein LOC118186475 [Stegodyphus dumicola]